MLAHRTLRSIGTFLKSFEVNFKIKHEPKYLLGAGVRYLSVATPRQFKIFTEIENTFAYKMLASSGHLKIASQEPSVPALAVDFDAYIDQNWSGKSPQELFEAFGILSKYCSENKICISNKIFDSFIDNLTDNIRQMTDEQLEVLFKYLKMWPETESVRTRNFIEVWAALDDACLARHTEWPTDKRLSFAALTFELSIARSCEYTNKIVQRLTARAKGLTPSQLVQVCFYMSVLRKSPFDKHNIELYLQKHFTQFTISDLAIMSMGFFKSKTPIRNMDLLNAIIEKMIVEIEEIDSVSLAALLKLVRYSARTCSASLRRLQGAVEGEVARLSVMACVHAALVGTPTQTFNASCLTRIAERVASDMATTRLKDLERLTLALSIFDFHPPKLNFVTLVLDELRKPERQEEIEKYPRPFACCVSYAATLGHYPHDLIDRILDPKFLTDSYGDHLMIMGREILVLDNTVEINCPDYAGNRLPHKTNVFLAKKYTDYVPDEDFKCQYNVSEKLVIDVTSVLRNLCGEKTYVCGDHALPHYQRGDIFMCQDKNGNSIDIAPHFPIKPFGRVKRAPTDDVWLAFVIGAKNAYIQDTTNNTGPYKAKCRELKKIGYHPIIVPWYVWDDLNSNEAKLDYIRGLIKEAVKT